jgi:putative inorganic carbon (HCO3(-)) transporter
LIYGSVIINAAISAYKKLDKLYSSSMICTILNVVSQRMGELLTYSKLLNFFKRQNLFARYWERSTVLRILEWLTNFPARICRKAYLRYEEIFAHSIAFRLTNMLLNRFSILLGLTLALTVAIPDSRWHNIYSTVIIFLLLVGFLIKTIIHSDESLSFKKLDFALVVFIISIFLAAVTSLFPGASFTYLVLYGASFIIVLLIVNSITTRRELEIMLELLLMGIVVTALYGLWQWKVVGVPVDPSLTDIRLNQGMSGRIYSTMGNPNIYGELLVLTMPFFWAVILNAKTFTKKVFYALLFALTLLMLILTSSRSAWVSFVFSAFVFVFFKNRKIIPFMIVAGILSIPLLPQSIYRRIMTLFNPNDTSALYRKAILEPAVRMLKEYWITGVGLGTEAFMEIYKKYKTYGLSTVAHTHNFYIQLWLEAGIVAILSFIWFILRIFKKFAFNISIFNGEDKEVKHILMAGIASIAGILVMGLADHIWFYNRIMLIFWTNIGIILTGLGLLRKKV